MSHIITFIVFITSLVNSCILIDFLNSIYSRKYKSNMIYVGIGVSFILLKLIVFIFSSAHLNVFTSFFAIFMCTVVFYNFKNKNMILNNIIFIMYLIIIESIIIAICDLAYEQRAFSEKYAIAGLLNIIVIICTYKLMIALLQKFKTNKISIVLHLLFCFSAIFQVIPIVIVFEEIIEVLGNNRQTLLLFMTIGFVIMDVGILYLFSIAGKQYSLEQEMFLMQQQEIMMIKQYNDSKKKIEQMQSFIHDVKRHLDIIESLSTLEAGQLDNYVNNIYQDIEEIGYSFFCKNRILNIIISETIMICKSNNIKFELNIQDHNLDFMIDKDITILFSNILDNAIESTYELKESLREIIFKLHIFKSHLVISLKNSFKTKPCVEKNVFNSTKKGHIGAGLGNVKKIVEKYSGNMKINYDECYFIVEIYLEIE